MIDKIRFQLDRHREKNVIFLHFEYDKEINDWVKSLPGVRWSNTRKAWYVLDTLAHRERFGLKIPEGVKTFRAYYKITSVNKPAFEKLTETLRLKSYSENTIKTYTNEFAHLLFLLKDKNVDELSASQLRSYFLYCTDTLKLSENTLP
jgi:hypothetical protein